MNETPRFMVKADDDLSGLVTVYVQCLPEDYDDDGETDRWACYDYSRFGKYNRSLARAEAISTARHWAWEISQRYPCEWGTNWEGPR